MAFQMNGGEFSMNGVPLGKAEKIEVVHDGSVKVPAKLPKSIEITVDFDAIAESVWLELMCHFGFASKPKLPDWASHVIRIPERRIKQILGG
jgi:hypothetical protein